MACRELGILIDTNIFVGWWDLEIQYGQLLEPIENDSFYVVICSQLYFEYLRQMKRRYVAATEQTLEHALSKFTLVRWAIPISESLIFINEKDQPHLDCAHNTGHPAHLLISDDGDFNAIRNECPIPAILSFSEFTDDGMRTTACSDAIRVCQKIKQIGIDAVFSDTRS